MSGEQVATPPHTHTHTPNLCLQNLKKMSRVSLYNKSFYWVFEDNSGFAAHPPTPCLEKTKYERLFFFLQASLIRRNKIQFTSIPRSTLALPRVPIDFRLVYLLRKMRFQFWIGTVNLNPSKKSILALLRSLTDFLLVHYLFMKQKLRFQFEWYSTKKRQFTSIPQKEVLKHPQRVLFF